MKTIHTFLVLMLAVFLISCGKSDKKTADTKNDGTSVQTSGNDKAVEIQCSGMTCTGCENTLKSRVKKVDGVKDVIADHKTNTVKASYDPDKTNPDAIKAAITDAGYKVESIK